MMVVDEPKDAHRWTHRLCDRETKQFTSLGGGCHSTMMVVVEAEEAHRRGGSEGASCGIVTTSEG